MKPILDSWTIVIVGKWNTRIFSPEWVAKHLFGKEKGDSIQLELQVAPDFRLRLSSDNIVIFPDDDKLIIGVKSKDLEVLKKAQYIAQQILTTLKHTPVAAVGINLSFALDTDPTDPILNSLKLFDAQLYASKDYVLKETLIKRTFIKDSKTINVSVVYGEDIVFEFNFHSQVSGAEQALTVLTNGFQENFSYAKEILTDIYELEVEEDLI